MLPIASKIRVVSVLCAIGTLASAASPAHARVGVTSQTDGDPLGRPPAQNERVLRAGIDIQSNEVVTTNSEDRAHIVFLDGTSLTISPNARLTIDKFVYDPNTKNGDLSVTISTGVLRVVGGKISKQGRISVNSPSASIGIRGGIGLFIVGATETRAHFLFGQWMEVTAGGRTEIARRAGSLVVTMAGGVPGAPVMLSQGAIAQALRTLEGASSKADRSADEKAKGSGFSARNSERGVDGLGGSFGGSSEAQQAVNNAGLQRAPGSAQISEAPFFVGPTTTLPGSPGGGSVGGGGGLPGSPPVGVPRGGPPFPATPATGIGNGGLIHATPGGPPR